MKLRKWQAECIDSAFSKYSAVTKHFLALATPGAGKTVMASVLAKRLFDLGEIDLVLCCAFLLLQLSPKILVMN
jgi:superfamily II DNA or RNA helicase